MEQLFSHQTKDKAKQLLKTFEYATRNEWLDGIYWLENNDNFLYWLEKNKWKKYWLEKNEGLKNKEKFENFKDKQKKIKKTD